MLIVFDFETGGLTRQHPNTQLAAVALDDEYNETGWFEAKIQFNESDCDPEALKINGYTADAWNRAGPEADVIKEFCEWMRPSCCVEKTSKAGHTYKVARLAGHNAAKFDMPRLTDAGKRHGVFIPAEWHVLDTIQLAMWRAQITGKWPENLQLSTLCNYYGVEVAGAHDALSDCRMTAALIDKMTLRS